MCTLTTLVLLFHLIPRPAISNPTHAPIDLTHAVDAATVVQWPSVDKFNFTIDHRGLSKKPDGTPGLYYEINYFSQSEHCGTHLDAPAHFAEGKWRAADIPLERLMGPAVVVDVTKQASENPDYELCVLDLEDWESRHGRILEGAVVVMYSGYGQHYLNRTRYLGYPPDFDLTKNPKDTQNLHFPGFHPEAAKWLTENRNIHGVGVDTPSTDKGQSRDVRSHRIFSEQNIWGLENLANVDQLEPTGYMLYAMVYKLTEGSGGPARVFAMHASMVSANSDVLTAASRRDTAMLLGFSVLFSVLSKGWMAG